MNDSAHNTQLINFIATAKCDNCLEIKINETLTLVDTKLRILGENRNLLIELKNPEYLTAVCIYTGKPMFVELHIGTSISVHYVEGSGKDFYQSPN
jgi:hypothetical protein